MRIKPLFFLALSVASLQTSFGQTDEKKFAITLNGVKSEYKGDIGSEIFDFNHWDYYGGGLSLSTYLNRSFNLGVNGNYGDYGISNYSLPYSKTFNSRKLDLNGFLQYKLDNGYILSEKSFIAPYLTAGLGVAHYAYNGTYDKSDKRTNPGNDLIVPVGAGIKFRITSGFAIQYQYTYNFTNNDTRDLVEKGGKDVFGQHSVGLVFSFGKAKDSDKDGIADKFDKCPDTPLGVKVDALGCPIDTDNDGTPDYLDKCPDIKGLAKFDGCPDTDGDGIPDAQDKCPKVAGLAKFDGCPDTDGDGIPDSLDKCPKVAGIAKFNGCPDTDGDGVPDAEDECPTVAGTVKGCPDKDKDGIPDKDDKCPNVPGIAANKGCPEVKAETKKVFAEALQGIQFETGKDIITKKSYTILDKVVTVMNDNPAYLLEINGHTDNVGDDNKNLILSDKRSVAVKNYLIQKGIAASRLTAKGYGETMPVAPNTTAAGKAQNRRVEFKVNF